MRNSKVVWAAGVLAFLGAVGGCGTSTPTARPAVVTQTVVREIFTTATPAPPLPSSASTSVEAPDPKTTPPVPAVFKMPNLAGENLQVAQDKLQALGSYLMDQQDAAGLGRVQVNDSNWKVCTQSPGPDTKAPVETMVVLGAVKLAEQCP